MPRVVISGAQRSHLSTAEAQTWLRAESARLTSVPGIEAIVLTRAQGACAWLCELHLADGADGHSCAEHPVCTEWLMDLRLLGMRPALAVLGNSEQVA